MLSSCLRVPWRTTPLQNSCLPNCDLGTGAADILKLHHLKPLILRLPGRGRETKGEILCKGVVSTLLHRAQQTWAVRGYLWRPRVSVSPKAGPATLPQELSSISALYPSLIGEAARSPLLPGAGLGSSGKMWPSEWEAGLQDRQWQSLGPNSFRHPAQCVLGPYRQHTTFSCGGIWKSCPGELKGHQTFFFNYSLFTFLTFWRIPLQLAFASRSQSGIKKMNV